MLISALIVSIQFCFDEHIMRKYSCHPLIYIGYEGVFGFFINLLLCFIFYFIKCGSYEENETIPDFVKNICNADESNVWRVENIFFAFRQIFDNNTLIILLPITLISMATFNIFGVSLTKYGSATTRSITDNTRSFLVWLWFLMPFIEPKLKEEFDWWQLSGFICICLGVFIYNGILKCEERKLLRQKKFQLEEVDETKLVESQLNNTNAET